MLLDGKKWIGREGEEAKDIWTAFTYLPTIFCSHRPALSHQIYTCGWATVIKDCVGRCAVQYRASGPNRNSISYR